MATAKGNHDMEPRLGAGGLRRVAVVLMLLLCCAQHLVGFRHNAGSAHLFRGWKKAPLESAFRRVTLLPCVMMDHIYAKSRVDSDDDLDLSDFELILDGIYVFSKKFGDCHVPVKFEVPEEDPWPAKLHKFALGKRLKKILSSQDFFDHHQDKVAAIQELGMEPSVKTLVDDWSAITLAMRHYKKEYGSLRVPSKFVVPDSDDWPRLTRGLKLGVRVAAIRSAGRYVKDHPERKQELDDLEFEWRLREMSSTNGQVSSAELFEQICEALAIYKEHVDKELSVSQTFVVPSQEPWPEHLWKLQLGSMVVSIRDKDPIVAEHPDRQERLNKLGFIWEESGRALFSKKRFEMVFAALVKYKEMNGDLFVPQAFCVPSEAPWPEASWGLKLGARVNAIRSQGTLVANAPERRELLDQLGFTWELPSHIKREKRRKADEGTALETAGGYSAADGGGLGEPPAGKSYNKPGPKPTPYTLAGAGEDSGENFGGSFTLPRDSGGTPVSEISGSSGTVRVSDLRLPGKLSGERRSTLDFDLSRMFEPDAYREVAAEALRLYMLDREFSDDPDVRQFSHFEGHLNAENFHHAISRKIPADDVKWMKKVGYRILEFGRFSWDDVATCLEIYHNKHGHVDVPHDFVIDEAAILGGSGTVEESGGEEGEREESSTGSAESGEGITGGGFGGVEGKVFKFPEHLEDLALGEAVAGLRSGDIDGLEDATRRKFLDGLGFDWGDKNKYQRYRFVPMIMGLKLYKHLFGFPMPQADFVVPDEPQWPYWMANMPLGEWAAVARVQQSMIEEHYPERRDMLNAMEFLWWVPVGQLKEKWYKPVR